MATEASRFGLPSARVLLKCHKLISVCYLHVLLSIATSCYFYSLAEMSQPVQRRTANGKHLYHFIFI